MLLEAGSGLVVCDGVGSSACSDRAAVWASKRISHVIVSADPSDISPSLLRTAFSRAKEDLIEDEPRLRIADSDHPTCLSTTVITVVERKDDYLIGYMGNGAVHMVPGDFLSFVRQNRWPWSATQVLVPQTSLSDSGTEILDVVLSPHSSCKDMRVISIEKDRRLGEILIVTTDGVTSPDHQRSGRDAGGRLWLQVDPRMEALLFKDFAQLPEICAMQGEAARQKLGELLCHFLWSNQWDDDATIGVLISKTARDLLASLGQKKG
jgi:hypothetical protein